MKLPPLPLDRVLLDWRASLARVSAYLESLGFGEAQRSSLGRAALETALREEPRGGDSGEDPTAESLDALTQLLLEKEPGAVDDAEARASFERWRLATWWAGGAAALAGERRSAPPCAPAPPLLRGSITPERVGGRLLGQLRARGPRSADASPTPELEERRRGRLAWSGAARRRHALLALLVLIPSVIAAAFMFDLLPFEGRTGLAVAISLFFGALFGWISIGFWTAVVGFAVLVRGDRFAVTRADREPAGPIDPRARTAIVMPVFEEPVDRVFAGLRAIRRSLADAGALEHFDIFVLSDSVDPEVWLDEEESWAEWRREAGRDAGIYYRRRKIRIKRKSGNVADFCRRWGRRYRYMVVLDADSVMSGEALVKLVHLMERYPRAGIIQTAPTVVRARSLFARVQQFSSRLYGPMFAAGLHFWQLGDCPFWGHNAIIRVEAFMAHCGLPRLSGRPPLGGDILSHDFVEAALLGRAGWSIWLAYDLAGSYEETPASLLQEMRRDRRWCQGNLQHLRLLFTEGLYAAHRALFLNGVFSYVSALLWLTFLGLSTAKAILDAVIEPDYFPSARSLFPEWPVWRPGWALWLLAATGVILFLPKLLAALLVLVRDARAFGGRLALVRSMLLEILSSALFAPIRMIFYCKFVLLNLAGRAVSWSTDEEAAETGWGEAFRRHGLDTAVAIAWAAGVLALSPGYFWWLTPVAVALVLSVPLSVLASREDLGQAARARGLFLTPEETAPPAEVRGLEADLAHLREARERRLVRAADAFVRAVADPYANALRCSLLRGPRSLARPLRAARRALVTRALGQGPRSLGDAERRALLGDRECLRDLHSGVWRLDEDAAASWGILPASPR